MDLAYDWHRTNTIVVTPKHNPTLSNAKLDSKRVKTGKRLRDIAQQKIEAQDIDPIDKLLEQDDE